jgi:hypothetical protein
MAIDIKIKIVKDPKTGEDCVPPEVLRILTEFGEHRKLCEECHEGWERKTGLYCATGRTLFEELLKQPEVEFGKPGSFNKPE